MSNTHDLTDIALSANEVRATEAAAYGEAREIFKKGLAAIMAHYGIGYQAAINKLRQLDLNYDEMRKLAAKAKKQPKIVHASNEEGSVIDDDDKKDADEQLDKLAVAVQRAHGEAGFSKQQALAYALDHFPEARELLRQSKQRSIDKNYSGQAVFEKVETDVSQPLPADIAKLSDADLSSLYRAGRFDKGSIDGRSDRHDGENTRPARSLSPVSRTPPLAAPSVTVHPGDRADLDAGNRRISDGRATPDGGNFDAKVKDLMNREGISRQAAIDRVGTEDLRAQRGF